jgi:SAM-dependent methyltransferase
MTVGSRSDPEWFRDWFGEDYLRLYPHRDEHEAAKAVQLYLEVAGRPFGRLLDLACGAGRHLRELRRHGIEGIGVDLSPALLSRARRSAHPPFQLVRADMRDLPFRSGSFSSVVSFFTSFGYFDSEIEDRRVAAEIRRVLETGGHYLLDYLNSSRVMATLVPEEAMELDGRRVLVRRSLEEDSVVKRIEMQDRDAGAPKAYQERVRLYGPEELQALLAGAGLVPGARFGDYEGRPFDPVSSGRLILAGVAV